MVKNADTKKMQIVGANIKLLSIDFKTLKEYDDDSINFNFYDNKTLVKVANDHFIVNIERRVNFVDGKLFDIAVVVEAILHFSEESNKNFKNSDDLKMYILERINFIIDQSPIMEGISLLISQITSSFGSVPLITPPVFKTEE